MNKLRKRNEREDNISSLENKQLLNTKHSKITELKYTCDDCGKLFYDKGAFRKHQLTHGERLFICKNCGKKFLDKSKLKRHSLVHSGIKQYKCDICHKMFSLDFNLRTHQRIHTGEKPYACMYPGCFKRFSQSSNLSAHEKTHEVVKHNGISDMNGWDSCYVNQNPVFSYNPLRNVIDNTYSSSLSMNNLMEINKLYDVLRKGIERRNQGIMNNEGNGREDDIGGRGKKGFNNSGCNSFEQNGVGTSIGSQQSGKTKLFVTDKGKPIFVIKKGYEDRVCPSLMNVNYHNECYNVDNRNNEMYYGSSQIKNDDYIYNDNNYENNGYIYPQDGIEDDKEYEYFPYSMAEFENFK